MRLLRKLVPLWAPYTGRLTNRLNVFESAEERSETLFGEVMEGWRVM